MKIAYVSGHVKIPSRGASSVHLMKMCSSYAELGNEVTLYVSNISTENSCVDPFSFYGVKNNFNISKNFLGNSTFTQLFQLTIFTPFKIFIRGADFVHARNLATAWACAVIFGLKVIFELHGFPEKNSKAKKMFTQLVKSKNCLFLISITSLLSKDLEFEISGLKPIYTLPDGYSWPISTGDRVVLKGKLKDKKKPIALYTGHLYEGRGIELIIKLAQECKNIDFVLVGGNPKDVEKYKNISKDIINIEFLGFVPPSQIFSYQKRADVLLMPYADKVFVPGGMNTAKYASPLKMFEYMSSGVPIVSSNLPILKEVLISGQNSIMVDYSNIEGWKNAIFKLIDEPKYAKFLSSNALKDVEEFSWLNRAKKVQEFLILNN